MSHSFWEERFAGDDFVYGTDPNRFLVTQGPRFRPGWSALAVADGEGRNGVWLASQGLRVTAVDQSVHAQRKAARLAAERGVDIHLVQANLLDWEWPVAAFDVVAAIFIHFRPDDRRRMHRAMFEALKPGGLLVMEVFHPDQVRYGTGGPADPAMLVSAETLRADLPDADFDDLEEREVELTESRHHTGTAAVTRAVAVRSVRESR